MIRVPKITLLPSAVTWARKIAILSPPSCSRRLDRRAEDDGDHRDVGDDSRRAGGRGQHAGRADRVVEAGRRKDRLDDGLEEARGDEGDADPQGSGEDARDCGEDIVEHRVAGPEMASIPST